MNNYQRLPWLGRTKRVTFVHSIETMSLKPFGHPMRRVALLGAIGACGWHANLLPPRPLANVTASSAPTSPPPPRTPTRVGPTRYDWVGIVGTGQSLSVGAFASPLTSLQPFHNRKILRRDSRWELAPLVEPIRAYPKTTDYQYPNNILGETPHSALANQLTALAMTDGEPDFVTIHSVVGWSGHCLQDIDKRSGKAYPASLEEVRAIKALAEAEHKTFAVGAVVLTHGECDANNANYANELVRFASEYDADLRAITGQSEPVALVLSQQNTAPSGPVVSTSSIAQWYAGVLAPGSVICAGPKYQYGYRGDGLHMDASNYRRLGEKYAEVIDRVFRRGESWAPLQPTSVRVQDHVVRVRFHVPNPPLQWDESLTPPHQGTFVEWAAGRGFEVEDTHGPVWISRADLDGDDALLTLRDVPRGKVVIRYATVQDARRYAGGDAFGRRGQLRDSDPLVGWDAETIRCRVERDSNVVVATAPVETRSSRDVALASGLEPDTIIREILGESTILLSYPWTGPTGEADILFHYDQRNYAVAFRLEVETAARDKVE